jgi:hypothetical protein
MLYPHTSVGWYTPCLNTLFVQCHWVSTLKFIQITLKIFWAPCFFPLYNFFRHHLFQFRLKNTRLSSFPHKQNSGLNHNIFILPLSHTTISYHAIYTSVLPLPPYRTHTEGRAHQSVRRMNCAEPTQVYTHEFLLTATPISFGTYQKR